MIRSTSENVRNTRLAKHWIFGQWCSTVPGHMTSDNLRLYTPRCAPGTLGIWSEVICQGCPGYRADILQPALRPCSNIGLPDICSMSGAQRSSMEAPVGNYLATPNSQIPDPIRSSPEHVAINCGNKIIYITLCFQSKLYVLESKYNCPNREEWAVFCISWALNWRLCCQIQ